MEAMSTPRNDLMISSTDWRLSTMDRWSPTIDPDFLPVNRSPNCAQCVLSEPGEKEWVESCPHHSGEWFSLWPALVVSVSAWLFLTALCAFLALGRGPEAVLAGGCAVAALVAGKIYMGESLETPAG
jgi:hypothetical protein